MKNVLFTLGFMLIGAFAFASTNTNTLEKEIIEVSVDVVVEEEGTLAAPAACWIVQVTVSCGGTYNTQYCNEGLHGTLGQWVMQVDSWACEQ